MANANGSQSPPSTAKHLILSHMGCAKGNFSVIIYQIREKPLAVVIPSQVPPFGDKERERCRDLMVDIQHHFCTY